MASEGPLSCGTGANEAVGDANWSNPTNIYTSNNARASHGGVIGVPTWHTVQIIKGGSRAGSNKATGSLPTDSGNEAYQTFGASNDLWGTTWTDTDINASNFGVSLRTNIGGGFTSQYLNATNFGFAIPSGATIDGIVAEVECYGQSTGSGFVDHVRITVHYTEGGGGGAASRLTKYAQNIPHMHGNNRFIRIGR
jgi:hypothetical protein